jgi:hypothetical protein
MSAKETKNMTEQGTNKGQKTEEENPLSSGMDKPLEPQERRHNLTDDVDPNLHGKKRTAEKKPAIESIAV